MFTRDAKWLNEEFVDASNEKNNFMGTIVVVRPVTSGGQPTPGYRGGKPASSGKTKGGTPNAGPSTWVNPDAFPPTFGEKKQ